MTIARSALFAIGATLAIWLTGIAADAVQSTSPVTDAIEQEQDR